MKHLFFNTDGDIVAADTAQEAKIYYEQLSGEPGPEDWCQLKDDEVLCFEETDRPQNASVWAANCGHPVLIATGYQ